MTRRSLLALPFILSPINKTAEAGNAVNKAFVEWSREWNAMIQEPGTLSLGEARAFEELDKQVGQMFDALDEFRKAYRKLRSSRTAWLRGF